VRFNVRQHALLFVPKWEKREENGMAKRAIDIVFSEETLVNLQSFKSVEELNRTVYRYKKQIQRMKYRAKKNAIAVLEYLKRHSCKITGVSWKGKRKIAADLGMSDKTVTRICKWLEENGFIRQYEMKRPSDMRQTANAIVIQPIEDAEIVAQLSDKQPAEVSDQENSYSKTDKQDRNIINKPLHTTEKIVRYVAIKVNEAQKRSPMGIKHLSAYVDKALNDLMERAKAKATKARAQQQRKQSNYTPIGLIFYDFTKEPTNTSASQPKQQAFDTDDMFAPLLKAAARIKGVEV
jgi:DNA-binding MarR family transcriptional regulator